MKGDYVLVAVLVCCMFFGLMIVRSLHTNAVEGMYRPQPLTPTAGRDMVLSYNTEVQIYAPYGVAYIIPSDPTKVPQIVNILKRGKFKFIKFDKPPAIPGAAEYLLKRDIIGTSAEPTKQRSGDKGNYRPAAVLTVKDQQLMNQIKLWGESMNESEGMIVTLYGTLFVSY